MKEDIINNITNIPDNLKIVSGDATNKSDFDKCKRLFNHNEKVVVINEGLLRYLNFEEKKIFAENVFDILKEYGGAWITCDVTPKKFIQNQNTNIPNFNNELSKVTDRNNTNWRFEDEDHIKQFLKDIGFKNVEFHYFNEVKSELTSPNKLNLDSDTVDKLIDNALVAIIRIN